MTLSDQAATGSADREAVAIALRWAKIVLRDDFLGTGETSSFFRDPTDSFDVLTPPDYQTDLPATLAEIERREWGYELSSLGKGKMFCEVWGDHEKHEATGTTIANAACAALLKALENNDATD